MAARKKDTTSQTPPAYRSASRAPAPAPPPSKRGRAVKKAATKPTAKREAKASKASKAKAETPAAAASVEASPAPAQPDLPGGPIEIETVTWTETGSTEPFLTDLQVETMCEVCGRELSPGDRIYGRSAQMRHSDGTIKGQFRARCVAHGPDLTNPQPLREATAEEQAEPEKDKEWPFVYAEAEMINEAIQGALSVLPPPENPARRMTAMYVALVSVTSHLAVDMNIPLETAAADLSDHYLANEQIRNETSAPAPAS